MYNPCKTCPERFVGISCSICGIKERYEKELKEVK